MSLADGSSAGDGWRRGQAGFRLDLNQAAGIATVQGDMYTGSQRQGRPGQPAHQRRQSAGTLAGPHGRFRIPDPGLLRSCVARRARGWLALPGGNLRSGSTAEHDAGPAPQAGVGRGRPPQPLPRQQHRHHCCSCRHSRNLQLWNAFAQDTISISPALKLTLGLKLEHNTYSKWEPQPDIRLAWQASDTLMVWAAAARAIRAPTPLDVDVLERSGWRGLPGGQPGLQVRNRDGL